MQLSPVEDRPRSNVSPAERAYRIRRNALRMGEVQGQGYIAQALGVADVLAVSYFQALNYCPADPDWGARPLPPLDRPLRTSAMIASLAGPDQRTKPAPFGHALVALAAERPEVVGLTADLGKYTDLHIFAQAYPERFYQMGMAEQLLMATAAGMAREGALPFATTYAVFASRHAYDFICMAIAEEKQDSVDVAVLHVPTIKPLDEATILREAGKSGRMVIVAENHTIMGGLGEAVAGLLLRNGVTPAFRQIVWPDEFLDAGALPTLHHRYGISTDAMSTSIKGWL